MDNRVAGFWEFDGAVTASKVELSPTPTEQVRGVSEKLETEEGAKEMKTAVKTGMGFVVDEDVQLKWTTPAFNAETGGGNTGKPLIHHKENTLPESMFPENLDEEKMLEIADKADKKITALTQTSKVTLDKSNESNAARGDKGADFMTAVAALEPFIFDGSYFDYDGLKNVSIPSLRIAPKVLLKAKAGLGPVKATQVRDYFKSNGYPTNKEEWQEWKNSQQNKEGE